MGEANQGIILWDLMYIYFPLTVLICIQIIQNVNIRAYLDTAILRIFHNLHRV